MTESYSSDPQGEAASEQARALAAEVLSRLGPRASETAGLEALVRHAAQFLDSGALFDEHTLFLGLLSSGEETLAAQATASSDTARQGNAASWFVEWLSARLVPGAIESQLAVGRTQGAGSFPTAQISPTPDLAVVFSSAAAAANLTVRRDSFDLRHLVAAMDVTGVLARQANGAFGVVLTGPDMADFEQTFVGRIEGWHERGEDPKAWGAFFSPPGQGGLVVAAATSGVDAAETPPAEVAPQAARAADRVTGFSPDQSDAKADPLGTASDVDALAKLICLEEVTPLSVAVFGGWGAGKTTFMNRLDARIRELAQREPQRRASAPSLPEGSLGYVSHVAPVWFNAWQFVDANLWASLTAELFDQLRSGGPEGADASQHAQLVEKVNQHVHTLSDDAEAKRKAAADSAKAVQDVKSDRDAAAESLRNASGAALGREALRALGDAYTAEKPRLEAMGLASAPIETFVGVVRDSASAAGQARAVGRLAWQTRRTLVVVSVVALLSLVALALFLWRRPFDLSGLLAALAVGVTLLGSAARALAPAVQLVRSVASRGAALGAAVQQADADAASQYLHQEERFRQAAAEADERQAEAQVASEALSRYADPKAASNPPRLLQYLLEDDPDTRALEKEVGLIGRTRRLFQALDYIMRHDKNESLERIVIFIDDLDRCTEEQVYHALQATQLLLAFRSFVVVVGVDVDWVERTLASQMGGRRAPDDPGDRQKAMNYLEKIFQVAFWLAPLSGPDGAGYGAYVHGLADPPAVVARPPPAPGRGADGAGVELADKDRSELGSFVAKSLVADAAGAFDAPDGEPAAEATGAAGADRGSEAEDSDAGPATLEVIQLDQREADFLASDAIAGIAAQTPRSVKRLVNVYRLVRARMEREGATLLGDIPDYPLIAFFVALETGQTATIANGVFEGLKALGESDDIAKLDLAGRKQETSVRVAPPEALAAAARACPNLGIALDQVIELHGGQLFPAEALAVARIARRYSFNRFQ